MILSIAILYIGRHVDYYDSWDIVQEEKLQKILFVKKTKFILSTWHSNKYRSNEVIKKIWNDLNMLTIEHFYHVGASENNRNSILEALLSNCQMSSYIDSQKKENPF